MGRHRAHHSFASRGLLALALAAALSSSCKKDDDGGDGTAAAEGAEGAPAKMVNRAVPGTPLEIQVPEGWRFDDVDPGKLPPAPSLDAGPLSAALGANRAAITLSSRTMLSARAPTSKLGDKVTAWLLVQHDPWLPPGTTTTDYLDAQRRSNAEVVPEMKHVDAERSRRQGRPAYYVRDEWSAPFVDREVTFSQETLLLIDADGEHLHGYSITVTLPKGDRAELAPVLREMLESVRFGKR